MNRLRIRHSTGFSYGGEVTASYNEARMLPASADGQLVLYSHLEILPISAHHSYVDYWGTRVSSFEVLTPHRELSLTATSLVEVRPVMVRSLKSPRRVSALHPSNRTHSQRCGSRWPVMALNPMSQ